MNIEQREELQEIIYKAQLDLKIDDLLGKVGALNNAANMLIDWREAKPEAYFATDGDELRSSEMQTRGTRPAVGNLAQALSTYDCEMRCDS